MAKKKSKKKVRARSPRNVEFDCVCFKQGEHELVLFMASAKALWELVEVNRRVEDKDEGYQRAASESRVKKLANFVDEGNAIPNSLLISFDDASFNRGKTKIKIPNRADAGWVIDGQHRLAGAHKATKDILLPVVAFVGLSDEHQINFFVTINREQKGVPSSLYYDLLNKLPRRKTETEIIQERAADLAQALKIDENSPFFGRIVTVTSPKKGEISMVNFVRKIGPLVKKDGRLSTFTDTQRASILNNYFRSVESVWKREYAKVDSVFFKTIGFGALINALPKAIDVALSSTGNLRISDFIAVLSSIKDYDVAAWHQLGTGNAAEMQAGEDLREVLQEAVEIGTIESSIKFE